MTVDRGYGEHCRCLNERDGSSTARLQEYDFHGQLSQYWFLRCANVPGDISCMEFDGTNSKDVEGQDELSKEITFRSVFKGSEGILMPGIMGRAVGLNTTDCVRVLLITGNMIAQTAK